MDFISPKDQVLINHWIQVDMTLLGVSLISFNSIHCVRFDVQTDVLMKIQVSWNCVLLRNPVVVSRSIRNVYFKIHVRATQNV
jgi:hypothetical protein